MEDDDAKSGIAKGATQDILQDENTAAMVAQVQGLRQAADDDPVCVHTHTCSANGIAICNIVNEHLGSFLDR